MDLSPENERRLNVLLVNEVHAFTVRGESRLRRLYGSP